jgi:hypothetical protein
MENQFGKWTQLWMTLAFVWTLVAAASAWIELPRASSMPHDPNFIDELSVEASAIVRGAASADKPAPGEPVWADTPRLFRMSNGRQLEFPSVTTAERAAVVENEYREILDNRAARQRWPYLFERLAWWLAPILVAAFAWSAIHAGRRWERIQPPGGRFPLIAGIALTPDSLTGG